MYFTSVAKAVSSPAYRRCPSSRPTRIEYNSFSDSSFSFMNQRSSKTKLEESATFSAGNVRESLLRSLNKGTEEGVWKRWR